MRKRDRATEKHPKKLPVSVQTASPLAGHTRGTEGRDYGGTADLSRLFGDGPGGRYRGEGEFHIQGDFSASNTENGGGGGGVHEKGCRFSTESSISMYVPSN